MYSIASILEIAWTALMAERKISHNVYKNVTLDINETDDKGNNIEKDQKNVGLLVIIKCMATL